MGYLIKHGFLRGYDSEHQLTKTARATRVFCSNRNRATGCGKTFKQYEMLKDDPGENKRRLAFSMQYANQLWQADTMFGPQVDRKQTKLIAFIDDASRVLCHGEFFLDENADSMIRALRSAFYKRGLPEQLLVDNGSIYCCQEITLICARVGCTVHSTLGMKPIDRFGVDLSRIRFLSPSQDTDELFYAEATRTVKKDNTFSFQGERYETPVDLRGKEVQLRYERHRQGKDSLRSLSHRIREFSVPMRAEADSRGLQPQSQWQNQVDLTDF